MKRCISCGRMVREFIEMPCPDCKEKIIRCKYCRENKNIYKCTCGFEGP